MHLCLSAGLSVLAAEAPASLGSGDINLPLITIRQFLDSARARGETNFLRLQGVVTASLVDKTYFLQDGDAGVHFFAGSAADVAVVGGPPWWTREPRLAVVGISLGALVLALSWGWTLRRQVRRQTAHLRAQVEKHTAIEHRYRQLFRTNPQPMWVFDVETLRFLAVNDAAVQRYGYSRDEFLGMTLRDLRPSEEVAAPERNVAAATPGLKPAVPSRHRKKDGQIIEVEATTVRLDFNGRTAELVLAHDVTEQRRAEIALRQSEERLALALQATSDGLWDWNMVTGQEFLSPRGKELLGLPRDEIVGHQNTLLSRLHPEDEPRVKQALQRHFDERVPYDIELRLQAKDGRYLWFHSRGNAVRDASGRPIRMVGTIANIMSRKLAQADLERLQGRFQTIFGASPIAILIARASDERIVEINPAFERLVGFTAAEAVGRTTAELGLWVDPARRTELISQLNAEGSVLNAEVRLRSRSGRVFQALSSAEIIDYAGERCMMSLTRDITERKAAEESLRDSRQRYAELVRTVEGIVWEADAQTFQFTFVSQQSERLLGYPVQRWLDPGFWPAHLHPDDVAGATGFCQEATRQGRNHELEYRMLATDGRVVWLHDIVTVIAEQGAPSLLRGLMVDITARKEAELERQHALETLQLFIDSVPGYISFVDADLRYQVVNPSYEKWFTRKRSEIVGRRLVELHAPEVFEEMRPLMERALAGEVIHYERCVPGHAGQNHWFDIRYIPRKAADGTVAGFFALVFDVTTQKKTELALIESRERLDGILSSLDDAVWSSTADGSRMLYLNKAAANVYGRPAADFLADPYLWLGMVHPDDREMVSTAFERLLGGVDLAVQYRIVRPDGSVRWLRDRARLVKDADGRPTRLDGIATDVTLQLEAEAALRESEEKHRNLVERMGEGLLMVNNEDLIQFANRRMCDLVGYAKEEMLGRNAAELMIRPQDQEHMRQRNRERQRGLMESYQIQIRRRSGEFIWCHNTATPVYGKDGTVIGSMAIMADITGRKQAEEALRETMQNLQTLVARSPVAMIALDGNARVQLWNPAAERMFGWSEAEVLNQPLPFAPLDGQAEFEALVAQEMPDDERSPLEQRRVRKDGTIVVVNLWTAPLRDAQGRITGTLGMLVDITARRRAEDELRKLSGWLLRVEDEERRRIARELHDSTAQNLAALAMSLSVLRQAIPSPDTRAAGLLAECKRLVEQSVQEIRTISYLLHPPLLDEFGLAWAVCDYADGFAKRSKIHVDLDVPENFERLPHPVELALFRVLQEGLGNVHRHSGSATASIRLARQADTVLLEVRDAGRGLDPATLGGSTLGVGITGMRERLRQLGGRVEIESGLPGTRLRAILPLEQRGT